MYVSNKFYIYVSNKFELKWNFIPLYDQGGGQRVRS